MARTKKALTNGEETQPMAEGTVTHKVYNFPKFSTILYFYAVMGEKKFPGQVTINGADDDDFAKTFQEVAEELQVSDEESAVTYEPREVTSAASRSAGGTPAKQGPKLGGDAPDNVPPCPIHNVKLKIRQNKSNGIIFYSCGEKNPDGSWCNWNPAKQG